MCDCRLYIINLKKNLCPQKYLIINITSIVSLNLIYPATKSKDDMLVKFYKF